jgi:amino acid transporter
MTVPVYLFLFAFGGMLVAGFILAAQQGPGSYSEAPAATPMTAILLLHTFAAGCTALTGIEAISNGITVFRPPVSRNASRTLWTMALLMGALFLGSIGLTHYLAIYPQGGETILSALARTVLGTSPAYFLVQAATLLILAVAANTSFADFPRVASVLARDRYLPHQFAHLGDR